MENDDTTSRTTGTVRVKRGLAEMLKGGVIMDVVTPDQAKIAEDAGAVAVMALERVPADIRADGGIARMSDPEMVEGIKSVVTIPVMAKARIGHFVEAQILEYFSLFCDFCELPRFFKKNVVYANLTFSFAKSRKKVDFGPFLKK